VQILRRYFAEMKLEEALDTLNPNVGTEVIDFCRDPYYLRGQPSCCRSTGKTVARKFSIGGLCVCVRGLAF